MVSKISFENSLEIINNISFDNLQETTVSLRDSLNRVLSVDIVADENLPIKPTSAMDGYAIKYEDINKNIKVISDNPAGNETRLKITKGLSIKTFTGSLMPKGSDTLVPIENITIKDGFIKIEKTVSKGYAVRDIGETYKKGELLIKKGVKIGFAQIGVMASLNITEVKVYKKPLIAVVSTGDEILDIGEKQRSLSQIRGSNHITMEAIAKLHQADVLQLGIIKDDKKAIQDMYKTALKKADMVVSTGGVSVGDYDFVKDIIKFELDANVLFHGVTIKPGQHIVVAKKGDKIVVGLPGFAYSSTVTFLLYVLPLIYKLQGLTKEFETIKVKSNIDMPASSNKSIFTAVNIKNVDGYFTIDMIDKKVGTSAMVTNLLGNSALLYQKPHSQKIKKGDIVEVFKL
ncbi:MAG: molybdopterin molybdenumtransferase MoeA [Campylobacteraceae bacterium 4484_166]|nr:MAG: molybdopterin molybdenumtransferase MoeA [Campylobacteraceae bacterium 4484_166]